MDLSYKERNSLYLSIGYIILALIAIITFIFSGGSYIFYTVAIIAIAIGFYMSYYISRPEEAKLKKAKKRY